jgi:hypothetical protein
MLSPMIHMDVRQVRSRHTIVAPDHRAVQRLARPMLGFTSVEAVWGTRGGVQ